MTWLLGVAVLAAGCGPEEPLHTEEPPRVLQRVAKPAKSAEKSKSTSGGGFGFAGKAARGEVDTSATPENRMSPELDDLENMMRRESRPRRPIGLWECKRCQQKARRPGKCTGDLDLSCLVDGDCGVNAPCVGQPGFGG